MKQETTVQCSAEVCGEGQWGVFHPYHCSRKATVEREGKQYCKQHDPVAIEAGHKTRSAKREAKWAAEEKAEKDTDRKQKEVMHKVAIGAELAKAVLALCPVSHGSGPVAPCFDEFDYEVEAKRGAWSVIDDAELEKLRALAREFQKAGDF